MLYLAQFVGSEPSAEKITAVAHTSNYAVSDVLTQLKARLVSATNLQIDEILKTSVVPEYLALTTFERDACAVLYGSTDLRPHITIRVLPPNI